MTKEHPFSWVEKVKEEVQSLDEIPLFGHAPPFDWSRFGSLLASRFSLPHLTCQPKEQRWISRDEMGAALGPTPLVIPIHLSPLAPPLFWAMGRNDREKWTSWMLSSQGKGKTFTSELLQEGYYRFLILEVLDAVQSLEPIDQMTLHLGDEAPFPEEEAFCIDIELGLEERSCWGRLIITPQFRKAWIHHFASFPAEYFPNNLSKKLELVVGVKTGSLTLMQSEWQELQLGDFLLLDAMSYDARRSQGAATLMLGEKSLFQVKIKQNKLQILDYAFTYEDMMQEQNAPEPIDAAEEHSVAIKDLPMTVTVELSRLKMTLEKLMSLTPGNLLELPIHPEQPVTLTVNGQKIAKAELVYLGETLGVRLLEIG